MDYVNKIILQIKQNNSMTKWIVLLEDGTRIIFEGSNDGLIECRLEDKQSLFKDLKQNFKEIDETRARLDADERELHNALKFLGLKKEEL